MKFTWNGDVPHSSVEWGWPFPVRAICLHLERHSAPQIPVEGLPVPGEFHEPLSGQLSQKLANLPGSGIIHGEMLEGLYSG